MADAAATARRIVEEVLARHRGDPIPDPDGPPPPPVDVSPTPTGADAPSEDSHVGADDDTADDDVARDDVARDGVARDDATGDTAAGDDAAAVARRIVEEVLASAPAPARGDVPEMEAEPPTLVPPDAPAPEMGVRGVPREGVMVEDKHTVRVEATPEHTTPMPEDGAESPPDEPVPGESAQEEWVESEPASAGGGDDAGEIVRRIVAEAQRSREVGSSVPAEPGDPGGPVVDRGDEVEGSSRAETDSDAPGAEPSPDPIGGSGPVNTAVHAVPPGSGRDTNGGADEGVVANPEVGSEDVRRESGTLLLEVEQPHAERDVEAGSSSPVPPVTAAPSEVEPLFGTEPVAGPVAPGDASFAPRADTQAVPGDAPSAPGADTQAARGGPPSAPREETEMERDLVGWAAAPQQGAEESGGTSADSGSPRALRWLLASLLGAVALAVLLPLAVAALRNLVMLD